MGHLQIEISQWCLNLNSNSSFVYIVNDKQKSVWNQPIIKSDQFLFQVTLSKSNSSSVTRVTAPSRAPAIVWCEIVSLIPNFDRQKLDLIIRAVKLHPASLWPGSSDVSSHRSQCHWYRCLPGVSPEEGLLKVRAIYFQRGSILLTWVTGISAQPRHSGRISCIVSDGRGNVFRFKGQMLMCSSNQLLQTLF